MPPRKRDIVKNTLRWLLPTSSSTTQSTDRNPLAVQSQIASTLELADEYSPNTSPATRSFLATPPASASSPARSPFDITTEEAKATKKAHSRAYEWSEKACRVFVALAKVVEPFLDGTPFKAPASVFLAIAEAVETAKDTKEGADNALEDLFNRLNDISRSFAESKDQDSQAMLSEYARKLVDAAQDLKELLDASLVQKLDLEGQKNKLEDVIARIERETAAFSICILLAIERDTKDIRDRLFRNDMKSWNRAPSAEYKTDVVEKQPARQGCTEGTRVAVLERIFDWANDPVSPPIFWLSGLAGSGKSTIAYSVCQHFAEDSGPGATLGASFFCSRQVADLRQLGNIVPTLVYQLTRHSRSFAKALDAVDRDVINVSAEHVKKLLLEPWAKSAAARSGELPPVLLVVDALDEIDDEKGAEFLERLIADVNSRAREDARHLKVFVTSRPHPSIAALGKTLGPDAVFYLEDIEKARGREDILTYLSQKLPDLASKHNRLLEALADRSDGLFIYAATVVRILYPPSSARSVSTSRKERRQKLSRFLEDTRAPSSSDLGTLYDLYKQTLHDAIPDDLLHLRLPILHFIVCALQPLTVRTLSKLVDLASDVSEDNEDEDSDDETQTPTALLVKSLHSVLYVSESDGCVYVYHKSFSDFMLDNTLSGPKLACNQGSHNAALSRACFHVMHSSLHFNMCDLPSSYLLDSEVPDLLHIIKTNILDVMCLEYACRYWASHTTKVVNSGEDVRSILELLSKFIDEKALFWIETMNLLGAKSSCYDGLREVTTWAESQADAAGELKQALRATTHFAQSFLYTAASASTPHLYISCLAFALNAPAVSRWKAQFAAVPQIQCTGTQGGLTHVEVGIVAQCVVFSPDGSYIVSGSQDHSLRIWDASTGVRLRELAGHTDWVISAMFSPDGSRVVSGSYDKSVRIWAFSTGEQVGALDGHTGWVMSVAFSSDGLRIVSGSRDLSVRIWDASTGIQQQELTGHTDWVSCVTFSPDGSCIVSGSYDQSVRIWDVSTGMQIQKLDGHRGWVYSVMFSPDQSRVVSGSDDKSVRIWDLSTGVQQQTLNGHTGYVSSVAFSPDGSRIVSGSEDMSVRMWDAATGAQLQKLLGHTDSIYSVAFSPDGWRVVSGSCNGFVQIWDASTGVQQQEQTGHTDWVNRVALLPDGLRVVSGSEDMFVRVWDALTGAQIQELRGHRNPIKCVVFSPDGSRIVSSSYGGTEIGHARLLRERGFVKVWDAIDGAQLQELGGIRPFNPDSVAFSPDGSYMVVKSFEFQPLLPQEVTGELLPDPANDQRPRSSEKKSVHLYKTGNGPSHVHSAVLSKDGADFFSALATDGSRIVSGYGYSVWVWDVLTGERLQEMVGHIQPILCAEFSPDGSHIASGSRDKSVRVWDASTGAQLQEFTGHTSAIYSVAFSLDGSRVVSGSHDKSVRIWDSSTGAQLQVLNGHTDTVASVAFSPDGSSIVSGSADTSVRIWNAFAEYGGVAIDWVCDDVGWVQAAPLWQRTVWLPKYLSGDLQVGGPCKRVISRRPTTLLNFDYSSIGPNWARCYQPRSS